MSSVNKQFWQGTNFWVALVLLIGGFFIGFDQQAATEIVGGVFALVAGVFGIREKIKGTVPVKEWLSSSNTWNYLGATLISVIPILPSELFTTLHQIMSSAIGGNWQGLAVGAFSLVTILWNLFRRN